jgi:hypothetical protein
MNGRDSFDWRDSMDSELAFCTTDELIQELMRRQTFCGVVVQAADEQRRTAWSSERIFKVHYNQNLDSERASRLLGCVSEYMNIHLE